MNPAPRDPFTPGSVEESLRLIATLPAPDGLEDRVMAALAAAPRTTRVLRWPIVSQPRSDWMRAVAAAAIVFVVAGGGWGIYSRVQPQASAGAKAAPPSVHIAAPSGGFSSAGAMRTPQTLNGPLAPVAVSATPRVPAKPAQSAAHKGKALKNRTTDLASEKPTPASER